MLLFDYCCVPFVVDINVLDTSFHCILQSILSIQVKCKLSLTEDDHTNFHFPASFLSNARSIVNKMDELKLQMAANRLVQDCCTLLIMETWLHSSIPDTAIESIFFIVFVLYFSTALRADTPISLYLCNDK